MSLDAFPCPALRVRAALFRAALHGTPKGAAMDDLPHLCGVRIERVEAGGVCLVATDGELLIFLRDPDGWIGCDATIQLPSAFFDAARRQQREEGVRGRDESTLEVNVGHARLAPGGEVSWRADETGRPYIPWRELIPARAARKAMPIIAPEAFDRLNSATQILSGAGLIRGFTFETSETGDLAVLNWGAVGFALAQSAVDVAPLPWRAPVASMLAALSTEARAS